jgi:hypothetical protein
LIRSILHILKWSDQGTTAAVVDKGLTFLHTIEVTRQKVALLWATQMTLTSCLAPHRSVCLNLFGPDAVVRSGSPELFPIPRVCHS